MIKFVVQGALLGTGGRQRVLKGVQFETENVRATLTG